MKKYAKIINKETAWQYLPQPIAIPVEELEGEINE